MSETDMIPDIRNMKTNVVYETTVYLNKPVSSKQVQFLNDYMNDNEDTKWEETWPYSFMESVLVDDADEYSDEVQKAVREGLLKDFVFQFDDGQSGKLYMETTRELTNEEMATCQDYMYWMVHDGVGGINEIINAQLDWGKCDDTFNVCRDANPRTDFTFNQILLEEYQAKRNAAEDDFTRAVESIETQETGLKQ